jgi:hypothetical protein
MTQVKWRMKGQWVKNCNCAYGCHDFNARPTLGHCQGMIAMKIDDGHFEAMGKINYEHHNTHSSLAYLEHQPTGVAR